MWLWRPPQGPMGPYRLSSVSLSSSSPPFLSVHCQLNKSICLNTQEGNRQQWDGLLQTESLACRRLHPPHGVKNNQHFIWLSRQTGALRDYYLSAMFVQQPEKTPTCFVYMQGNSRNSEKKILLSKKSNKMWPFWHILWLHIKKSL